MAGKILLVDDEKDMLLLLERIISEERDHELSSETNPLRALELFKKDDFDLVITDLKMPKMDGITLLHELKGLRPDVAVVVITAYATIETAVEAIQKGAFDYVTKPFRRERILITIDKAMKWQEMVRENLALKQALNDQSDTPFLIGTTPVMKEIFERIRQVAPAMATVLVTGPSGTGKELVAKAIHRNSLRSDKKFITINCTAIPEHVIESELFGHVKGAFTGAWKDKKGLVEEADGGTLFLDEIGDLSPQLQTKLLRLVQEGEYKPVGSVQTRKADVRFIAATNHNLRQSIKDKTFREDLYYRLNVVHIDLPPLKDRKGDVPVMVYHFLKKYSSLYQKGIVEISDSSMQFLLSYDFPGNVRELENIIERGVIFCRGNILDTKDLFMERELEEGPEGESPGDRELLSFKEAKENAIQMFHRRYIQSLLRESGGNISRAAEVAGIQRQYLHRLMKDVGIEAEEFKNRGGDQ